MKTKLFLAVVAVAATVFSCGREVDGPLGAESGKAAFAQGGGLPSYTKGDVAAMVADHSDEAVFVQKAELLTYSMTRYLGDHLTHPMPGGPLSSWLPCDMALDDDLLRLVGTHVGATYEDVLLGLGQNMETCIKDCNLPVPQKQALVLEVLNSLVLEGEPYVLRTTYPATTPVGSDPRIFLSYGISWTGTQYRALGFEYNLQSRTVSRQEKTISAASNMGGLLLRAEAVSQTPGVARENDPCHYALGGNGGGGGSGGGGNGGGTSGLDDDGGQKNGFAGGVVSAPGDLYLMSCTRPTGVRISEMHLARRAEGGLFAGKSEVYVDVTVWRSTAPATTWKTNDLSSSSVQMTVSSVPFFVKRGKELGEIPPAQCSATARTIVTSTSGFTPNNGDWVLIDEGFCDDTQGIGYDRMFITVFENDKYVLGMSVSQWLLNIPTATSILYEGHQYMEMTSATDVFLRHEIKPSDFPMNTQAIYLDGYQGIWNLTVVEPPVNHSWIKIELF